MLNAQTRIFEQARAIVENEGMRIHRELQEFRNQERGASEVMFECSLRRVRESLKGLGLPEIVLLGVEARIADAEADEEDAGPDVVSDVLQKIGCDFVDLRDWRAD